MNKIISFILIIFGSCTQTDITFDSEKWKNWIETESTMSLRWDMRKDLIKKHKLIDLTKDEVIDLLGEPEQKIKIRYMYNLGAARHYIDYGTLILDFKNDKVIDYKIISG